MTSLIVYISAILAGLSGLDVVHPLILLQQLGDLAEKMGGSSGGVYSLLFTAAARAFQVWLILDCIHSNLISL